MKSPVPPHAVMERVTERELPTARRCPVTGGLWIRPDAYWAWAARQPERTLAEPTADRAEVESDSPAGKRCPEDGGFLLPHRVGHGLDLHLDRCGRCGGMWFDHGEWEAVRGAGLLDRLHLVFTSAWQARVRQEHRAARDERAAEAAFGPDLLSRLRDVRELLRHHPRAGELRAYLLKPSD